MLTTKIEGARLLTDGVWEAQIPPDSVLLLGQPTSTHAAPSVVTGRVRSYDAASLALELVLGSTSVFNLGPTSKVIVLASDEERNNMQQNLHMPSTPNTEGDDLLYLSKLNDLPENICLTGKELLSAVRKFSNGRLSFKHPRFVETPDNFWTAAVQPRDRSIAITVRGTPERFQPTNLRIVDDRPGYSRFKIERSDQLDEALRIIRHARRK